MCFFIFHTDCLDSDTRIKLSAILVRTNYKIIICNDYNHKHVCFCCNKIDCHLGVLKLANYW